MLKRSVEISLRINADEVRTTAGSGTPLLYILRNDLRLNGLR